MAVFEKIGYTRGGVIGFCTVTQSPTFPDSEYFIKFCLFVYFQKIESSRLIKRPYLFYLFFLPRKKE